jgi:hypothetical protein
MSISAGGVTATGRDKRSGPSRGIPGSGATQPRSGPGRRQAALPATKGPPERWADGRIASR